MAKYSAYVDQDINSRDVCNPLHHILWDKSKLVKQLTPNRPHPHTPAARVICCSCPLVLRPHNLREVRVHTRTAESWNAPASRVESSEIDRAFRLIRTGHKYHMIVT